MWATWCTSCMEQMPHFQSIYEKYSDKINILAINNNEDRKYIDNVITKFGLTMPILLNNEGLLAVTLGLIGTPYSVLINTDDNIVYTSHESDNILDTFISSLAPNALDINSDKPVTHILPNNMVFDLSAQQYARDRALAQFYFHLMTAYSILRREKIELGKADKHERNRGTHRTWFNHECAITNITR